MHYHLILFDTLAEFGVLETSKAQLAKGYVSRTEMLYPLVGKRLLSKEEEKTIVEELAKEHNITYLQARRRIDSARHIAIGYIALIGDMSISKKTPSQKREELEKESKDPNISHIARRISQEMLDAFDRDMKILQTYSERIMALDIK